MKKTMLALARMWRELRDPYRPELHYMRGPGPRCLDQRNGPGRSRRASDGSGLTQIRA